MGRRAILWIVGVATAWLAGDAHAADDARAVVIVIEGGDADAVGPALAARLSAPNAVHDARVFRAALAAHGTRSLAAGLGGRAGSARLLEHARAAAGEAHVDRAILVESRKGNHGKRQVHVWLVDPHSADALIDTEVPVAASADASGQADAVWLAVSSEFPAASARASAGSDESTRPAASPPDAASPGDGRMGNVEGTPTGADAPPQSAGDGQGAAQADGWLLVARADVAAASRHFSYVDRMTSSLRPYDLVATPFASLGLEIYPFARAPVPVLRGLGLIGDYGRAVGLSSTDTGGSRVGTSWQSFDVGLRERVLLDPRALVGVDVAYGANAFHFDQPGFTASLPSTDYAFVRAGLDVRMSFGRLSLLAGGGYLDVLKAGTLDDLFPRETVGGVDAFLGGAYPLGPHLELSVRLDYARFFYAFHPLPGDGNVAGGALDEMARLSLGLATTL